MRTLRKCDEPLDFQAVATATRAILEIAVDLSLILEDRNNAKKIDQWEDSAKPKQASSLMLFYRERRKNVPPDLEYLDEFTRTNRARIERIREENGWMKRGKPVHPPRWTGADLGADCIKATKAYPDVSVR